jgi:hypothetical protein
MSALVSGTIPPTSAMLLSISVTPPRSAEVEYYEQTTVSVLITSNAPYRVLIEQLILRFQSDANEASIYVEQSCGWELTPGELREQLVSVYPIPNYLANTNVFDVMVKFRSFETGVVGQQKSEVHRGSYLIIRNTKQRCGQLFISFKQPDDLTLARMMDKFARRAGFSPYLAIHDAQPGTDQWKRIELEIRASIAISIIWTSHTDWGRGVQQEIILARQYSIPEMLLIEEQLELPESHRGTNVEYQRFDANDPAQPFSKMLTTRRAIVLDQIRRRAYELYEARGREDGHELEDWLRAQAEVTVARA